MDMSHEVKSSSSREEVAFVAIDQYIATITQNMVDNVCMHDARVAELGKRYEQTNEENTDGEEVIEFNEELVRKQVPVNVVPDVSESGNNIKKFSAVDITNELGITAGKFGWCLVCRNKADLYCKDTRHPVCSYECKKKHVGLVEQIEGV